MAAGRELMEHAVESPSLNRRGESMLPESTQLSYLAH